MRVLVARDPDLHRARYRLLEPIRAYGLKPLDALPDARDRRARYAERFLSVGRS